MTAPSQDPAGMVTGIPDGAPIHERVDLNGKPVRARRTDDGFLCSLALRCGQFWDFIDRRDIDKHLAFWALMYGTVQATEWGMLFASLHPDMDGLKMAAIIAAVLGPATVLQTAAVKWYFESRATDGKP